MFLLLTFLQVIARGEQLFQSSYITKQLAKRGVFRDLGPIPSLQNVKDICGGVLY